MRCGEDRVKGELGGRMTSGGASRETVARSVLTVSILFFIMQKNEGDARTRRPRGEVAIASTEIPVEVGPKTNGSKNLLVFTEELKRGAFIPRHRHHGE